MYFFKIGAFAEKCKLGVCLAAEPKDDGGSCDDGDKGTESDRCVAGQCFGKDMCANADGVKNECVPPACRKRTGDCVQGECNFAKLTNGEDCSDGSDRTKNDKCSKTGTCVGQDTCNRQGGSRRECPAPKQCFKPTECLHDECKYELLDDVVGKKCNDGVAATTDDACDADGNCAGVDKCAGVKCDAVPCAAQTQCDVASGKCVGIGNQQDGTKCEDGIAATFPDKCVKGKCVGEDLCLNMDITCPKKPAGAFCLNDEKCFRGACAENPKPDGTPCNDGNARTTEDNCQAGKCKGADKCDANTPGAPKQPTFPVNQAGCNTQTCFQGTWTSAKKQDGTACKDGDEPDRTTQETCIGGICVGVDLCKEDSEGNVRDKQCAAETECLEAQTCFRGECEMAKAKADGETCTDQSKFTLDDRCSAGVCIGEDKCKDNNCAGAKGCRKAEVCNYLNGQCDIGEALADGTQCDDGSDDTRGDKCGDGTCKGERLTCKGVDSERITFSNGCGGYDISGTRWSPDSRYESNPCHCTATATLVDYAEVDGSIRDKFDCAQAICAGGNLYFRKCEWLEDGKRETVATGRWKGAYVDVPWLYQDNVCNDKSFGGEPVPPDPTTTAGPTTTRAPTTTPAQTTTTKATTTKAPEMFDFLQDAASVSLGNNNGEVGPSKLTNVAPVIRSKFQIAVTTAQVSQTRGYLAARTSTDGSKRYYGLYVSQDRIQLWYQTKDGKNAKVTFPFLNPGSDNEFKILLTVDGKSATLKTSAATGDFEATKDLEAEIQDCDANTAGGCELVLGARMGPSSYQVLYQGHISYFQMRGGSFWPTHPDNVVVAQPKTVVSLIAPGSYSVVEAPHDTAASTLQTLGSDGSIKFNGAYGLAVNGDAYPGAAQSTGWTASFAVRQDKDTAGYLFAKTSSSGNKRYYAVYLDAKRNKFDFYYRHVGMDTSEDRKRARIANVVLGDGKAHRVTVTVAGVILELLVDDKYYVQKLDGELEDCGAKSDDCVLHVGMRGSFNKATYFPFQGEVYTLDFVPQRFPPRPARLGHPGSDPFMGDLLANNGGKALTVSGTTDHKPVAPLRQTSGNLKISTQLVWGSKGYVFCKSDAAGFARYYCLYANTKGRLTLYYRPAGVTANAKSPRVGFSSRLTLTARQTQIIHQNGTKSGFEMCFAIGSRHLRVLGVPTKTRRLESNIKTFIPPFYL